MKNWRYYIALRQTQGTIRTDKPDWQPWLVYFLGVLSEQKLRLAKRFARERILLGDLPELSVQILELCRERGHASKPRVRAGPLNVMNPSEPPVKTVSWKFLRFVQYAGTLTPDPQKVLGQAPRCP
jgi:hypothetical protein